MKFSPYYLDTDGFCLNTGVQTSLISLTATVVALKMCVNNGKFVHLGSCTKVRVTSSGKQTNCGDKSSEIWIVSHWQVSSMPSVGSR